MNESGVLNSIHRRLETLTSWPLAFRSTWLVILSAFFPVMFGVFDLFENVGIILMLNDYPAISRTLVGYSNAMTVTKQLAIQGATIAFVTLPLIAAVVKTKHTA